MYDELFINHTNTLSMVCKIIILFYIKNLQDLIEKLLFDINRNTVDLEYGEFFDLFEDKFGELCQTSCLIMYIKLII